MTVRRFGWAALMGMALVSGNAPASEPARLALPAASSESQKLADTVASWLRQSGNLHNYRVDVSVRGGAVELTGKVADQAQRDEVLRLVQGVPGVVRVIDHMTLATSNVISRVQAETPPPPPPGSPEAGGGRLPAPLPDGRDTAPPPPPAPSNGAGGAAVGEPVPMFRTPVPGYAALNPPRMPPYAWPTYAPYNNFSRVGYPQAYPYNAWPFIGPVYPFPKIPLGWRSVKLEWDDGYWWYGRVGCHYDWWKIRYW